MTPVLLSDPCGCTLINPGRDSLLMFPKVGTGDRQDPGVLLPECKGLSQGPWSPLEMTVQRALGMAPRADTGWICRAQGARNHMAGPDGRGESQT